MASRIPQKAGERQEKRKGIKAIEPNVFSLSPTWRFRRFDVSSKWGISSLCGAFTYIYQENLFEAICEEADDELDDILVRFNGKIFSGWEDFLTKLEYKYKKALNPKILSLLCKQLSENIFSSTIWPKLRDYESMEWGIIERAQHGKQGKSKNHFVNVKDLSKDARDRLSVLGVNEDQLYSLRLDGLSRIYGIREVNVLEILWIDLSHEIYPLDND